MPHSLTQTAFLVLCLAFICVAAPSTSEAVRKKHDNASPSYAPRNISCPSNITFVRPATSLSTKESNYVTSRRSSKDSLRSRSLLRFLNTANLGISQDELESYASNVTTALAFSGGGYRAMLNAAGIFNSLDSRTSSSNFSGLLQGMDYITGLSGGNWLLGSTVVNNFATIPSLREHNWQLNKDLVTPGDLEDTISYLSSIHDQVDQKDKAHFATTITDYWGLALGRQLVNRNMGGVNITWSDIRKMENFRNMSMPFPIVVADGRREGEILAETNATIYEFNPFEFGSWDSVLQLFFPIEYLGTSMDNGKPVSETCAVGFDYAGFVMGTSSSLFNSIVADVGKDSSGVEGAILRGIVAPLLGRLSRGNGDIAEYPNPFQGYNPGNNSVTSYQALQLVDGGEDNQNIPLWPLIQPQRQVDVILAVDSSADTEYSWPNGSSLLHTYHRTITNGSYTNTLSFPTIPGSETFIALGLNQRPSFFGCDARNHSGSGPPPPLIVYLPNTPWSYYSNLSTFKLEYKDTEIDGFIDNGREQIGQGDNSDWNQCLACAILQRARERSGNVTGFGEGRCKDCFDFYCWNGTTVGISEIYEPRLKNGSDVTYEQQKRFLKGT